ncbi:MAG: TonB-dependent receptor [Steroidobacteraceae bacterium]|nr:TonB-dependent receptor [Steroidobacteraceae bacterium]
MNKYQSRTLLAAAVAAAIAGTASAQDDSSGGLDEVTVTAQRREQSLQDVPISISAFGQDQLTSRNIVDTYDLVRNVPNLTGNANVGVGTSTSLYIRGIGNAESIATFDVPVGTYVDEVYISRQNQNNFGMFDVERIEVLRGPQGTLFGRNTTGGAINLVMRKPGTEKRAFVEAGTGSFGLQQFRASVDVPMSDRVLTKFSAYRQKDDGFATQLSTGISYNDRDATGGRVDLRFLPTDALTIDLVAEYIDDRNTNFLNVVANDEQRVINNRLLQGALIGTFTGPKAALAPGNEATTRAFTLNAKWDISDALSLSSITGYRDTNHEFLVDSGGELPRVTTTRGFTPLANIGNHEQISQEFKLNGSSLGDTLTWVAGIFWMTEDNVTDFANANTILPANVFSVAADRTMTNGLDTYAFYAQGDYEFADRWTATLGIRYTDEKKDFAMQRNPGALGVNLNTAAIAAAGIPLELDEQVWTPRVALNFDATDDVSLFVSATRGFKSGGWPARAVDNRAFIPFDPEKVTAYEAGLRSTLFDNTLRMNVTAFYSMTDAIQIPARIDIDGFQLSTTTNPADMRNVGLEVDAEWAPTDAFTLVAGLGLQNAEYTNVTPNVLAQAAACRANPNAVFQGAPACNANFVDQFGNIATPVRAPDFTISLNATYDFDVGPATVSPTVGWNYSDEYAIGTTGSPQSTNGTWSGPQGHINAQVAFRFENAPGLLLAIDCRNCANKAYPMSALGPFQFLDRPGTWGARIRYTF